MEVGISAVRLCVQVAALALSPAGIAQLVPAADVDLALILAVDVSSSMNEDEMRMQRDGYVAAFRHPALMHAILSGTNGRIVVSYLEWAGPDHQQVVIPWTLIDDGGHAASFADALAAKPLAGGKGTSIAGGLTVAERLFADSGTKGARRVIDLSGDGPSNTGLPVAPVRDRLVGQGITINGLPIILDRREASDLADPYGPGYLEAYYEDCVIGGPDAFLVLVDGIDQFQDAILMKLVHEIAGSQPRVVPAVHRAKSRVKVDCLNLWQGPGR